MRRLIPFIAATTAVLAVPAVARAQEGCPIGRYLEQTDSSNRSDDVACLQAALNGAGYNSGPVDGWFGPVTESAVVAYQTAAGLTVDGEVGEQTAGALSLWSPRRQAREEAPEQRQANTARANAGGGTVWDALARCESGGNWSIATGNGYFGGLQFLPSTWRANGGVGMPHEASREEQIRVAENVRAKVGYSAWPACARRLGLR